MLPFPSFSPGDLCSRLPLLAILLLGLEGTAAAKTEFSGDARKKWTSYRDDKLQIGGRYTDYKRTQIEDQIQSWLRSRGFAFSEVRSTVSVDTTQYAADLQFSWIRVPAAWCPRFGADGISRRTRTTG